MTDNRFDEKAATWDADPSHVERAVAVAGAIRAALPLDPSTRVLEYGAGTGLVSQHLRPAVGPITMVDTSAGMRAVMLDKIAAGVIPNARVWDLDLGRDDLTLPDEQFDLVVTVMTLHHVHDTRTVLANFGALLAPDGHLAIVDLDHEDGSFHYDGFDGHHGFDHGQLTGDLAHAGFGAVTFQPCHHVVRDGREYPMFLALASRASA